MSRSYRCSKCGNPLQPNEPKCPRCGYTGRDIIINVDKEIRVAESITRQKEWKDIEKNLKFIVI